MRLRQTAAGRGNAEVAVMRVGAQAVCLEVLVAIVTDGDALLWTRRPVGRLRAAPRLERFAGGRFGGNLARRGFLLLSGGAGRSARSRLPGRLLGGFLLGHRRSP